MQNPQYLVSEILRFLPNERTREVIVRRFGLKGGQRNTLDAIGQDYKITRERVRQIEANGLAHLKQPKSKGIIQPLFQAAKNHLIEHGSLKREDRLYDDLTYVCYPVKEIERMKKENNLTELNRCQAAFYLILTLGEDFERVPENDTFYPVWTINKNSVKTAKKVVDSLVKHLNTKKQVLPKDVFLSEAKLIFPDISAKVAHSYIDASKRIEQNQLGHFGLVHWPEISPRGVRDKAYIILKNEGKPLHFNEITERINKILPSKRRAYTQTVHNELIKGDRFVLVGRGIYGLGEWGYEPGTVSQTISQILKKEGALDKEAVVQKVMEKRLVKENTVLINLQNKKLFQRDESGRYSLRV